MTVLAAASVLAVLTALEQLEQPAMPVIVGQAICTELTVYV